MNKMEELSESTDENEQVTGFNVHQTQIQPKTNAVQTGEANEKQTQNERETSNEAYSEHSTESFTDKELQSESEIYGNMEAGEQSTMHPAQNNPNATCTANAEPTENKRNSDAISTENANETQTNEGCDNTPERSEFINAISEKVDERGFDERFINPLQYWPRQQAEQIGKINKYLRCLLENTLKLSRYRNIPASDLLNLANAYTHVIYSQDFENSGHPYGDMLKGLHKKLAQLYKRYKGHHKLKLVLRREEKIEIISMLHEIGDTAPLKKFSELFKR